jgi:hypothetical protein
VTHTLGCEDGSTIAPAIAASGGSEGRLPPRYLGIEVDDALAIAEQVGGCPKFSGRADMLCPSSYGRVVPIPSFAHVVGSSRVWPEAGRRLADWMVRDVSEGDSPL